MIVKSLKLSFKDKLGKNKMISLEYPKADLNANFYFFTNSNYEISPQGRDGLWLDYFYYWSFYFFIP